MNGISNVLGGLMLALFFLGFVGGILTHKLWIWTKEFWRMD